MKRKILFLAFVIGFLFANAQNFPFPVKYSDHYITTPIFDTIGFDFYTTNIFIYDDTTQPYFVLNTGIVMSYNAHFSDTSMVTTGFAQPFHSDTLLELGGVAFWRQFENSYNTGDSLFIIDELSMQTIYAMEIKDTLQFIGNAYGIPPSGANFHDIIFDSMVQVQGDFLVAYKYNKNNISVGPGKPYFIYDELCTPIAQMQTTTVSYNSPLRLYGLLTVPSLDYQALYYPLSYGQYDKQIYYYNDDLGWKRVRDYRDYYSMIEEDWITNIDVKVGYSYGNLYPTDKTPVHTTDLCCFLIPEAALDSEDLARRPVIEIDTIPIDTTITDTIPTDTIPTDTTITDSTDTNFLSQIDLERMIAVQPNPTKGEVVISCPEPVREVALLNPMGQVLYRENYNQKRITLDLSSYPQGVYILHLQTSSGEVRKKIVKQ